MRVGRGMGDWSGWVWVVSKGFGEFFLFFLVESNY